MSVATAFRRRAGAADPQRGCHHRSAAGGGARPEAADPRCVLTATAVLGGLETRGGVS